MKEVQFRTIDKLFIKMSINDKMWVIFLIFLVALGSLSTNTYLNQLSQIEQNAKTSAEQQLKGMLSVSDSPESTLLTRSSRATSTDTSINSNGSVTATQQGKDGQYYSLTLPATDVADQKQSALNTFLLSFLWCVPFGIFCYWVATFIGGALWVLYSTTEKIGDGDLSSRLGFHPGRDEFGTIG